jgi:hypothetical protein
MVAPAAGIAMMNSRSSPRRSAAPVSSASRSSLRAALNTIDQVHGVDPGPEPAVEPLVGQRYGSVLAAVDGREQREPGALLAGWPVAAAGGEAVQGLALPSGEQVIEAFGDADRGVVVADLGLVVPEHRQPAVAADAVPPEVDDLADAAAQGATRRANSLNPALA